MSAKAQDVDQVGTAESAASKDKRHRLTHSLRWLLLLPVRLFGAVGMLLFMLLTALLCALIYFTGTTAGGLQLLRLAGDFAPVSIDVESADGYLLDKLTLNGLVVKTDAADVNAGQVVLHWSPAELLHGRARVEEVRLQNADVYLKPTEPTEEPSEPAEIPERIKLPIGIQLDLLHVENLRVHPVPVEGETAEPMVIEKAVVTNMTFNEQLSVSSVEFVGFDATANLTDLTLEPVKPFPFSVGTQWSYQLPEFPLFEGGGPLAGDLNAITLKQQLQPPLNASLNATLADLLTQPNWDAKLNLKNLKPQKIKSDLPELTLNGDIAVTGKLDAGKPNYQTTADVAVKLPNYPKGSVKWRISGDAEKAKIESLNASWAGGTLKGGGNVGWAPNVVTDLKLSARNFNPKPLAPDWPGNINGDLAVKARLENGAPQATVVLSKLGGELRGYPLAGGMRVSLSPQGTLVFQQFNLKSGSASVALAGKVFDLPVNGGKKKPRLDMSWKIDAPDMQTLLPQASGVLRSEGKATGRLPTPAVDATLMAEQLVMEGLEVGSADAKIKLSDKQLWEVDLEGRSIKVGDENIRLVSVGSTGGINQHGFKIALDADSLNARLQANGKWQGERWVGQLEQLSLAPEIINGWALSAPTAVEAGPKSARLSMACLVAENDPIEVISTRESLDAGRSNATERRTKKRKKPRPGAGPSPNRELCLKGQWSAQNGWQADVDLKRLNMQYFRQFLPVNPEIITEINGRVTARGKPGAAIAADAELQLDPGSIKPERDDVPELAFGQGGVTASLRNEQLDAKLSLPLLSNSQSMGQIAANIGYRLSDSRLSGAINTVISDLAPIASFSPELEQTRGELLVDFDISGTAQQPRVVGKAHIREASAIIPAAGLQLKNIDITLIGEPQGRLNLEGSLNSGGGKLSLAGAVELVEGGANANVEVKGADFQALDTTDARVWISPDIRIKLVPGQVDVTGKLLVPRTEITPKKLPESRGGVSSSGDVIIVGEEAEELQDGMAVNIDVQLALGDEVMFEGFGLKAELGGQLRFVDTTTSGQRATGELLVKTGQYQAFGQDLSISDGRLIFAGGPLDNPGMDIKATRLASDGTLAGLLVRGSVRKPTFSVYSEPAYPDDIALAYLITGKPPGQAGGAGTDAMGAALAALTQRGGSFLANRLGSRLGVDDIQFDAGDSLEAASVTIGRYLTPKLYVSYGVGLFDSESSVQLRYQISNRFRLETQSGENVGGDLFFSLER